MTVMKKSRTALVTPAAAADGTALNRRTKSTTESSVSQPRFLELPIAQVHRNPKQPRQHFDEAALHELAASIKADGLLVPVSVRPDADGYELIHGERRWRASQIAELTTIRAEVRDISPDEAYTLSIIENEQREGLSAIETARALKSMMDAQDLTPGGVANRIGKSRDWVSSKIRLLNLPDDTQALVKSNSLSEGHAKQLLKLNTANMGDKVSGLARQATSGEWSVARLQSEVDAVIAGGVSRDTRSKPCPYCGGTGFVLGQTEAAASGVSRDTVGAAQ